MEKNNLANLTKFYTQSDLWQILKRTRPTETLAKSKWMLIAKSNLPRNETYLDVAQRKQDDWEDRDLLGFPICEGDAKYGEE